MTNVYSPKEITKVIRAKKNPDILSIHTFSGAGLGGAVIIHFREGAETQEFLNDIIENTNFRIAYVNENDVTPKGINSIGACLETIGKSL